jgi:hypothetical protein
MRGPGEVCTGMASGCCGCGCCLSGATLWGRDGLMIGWGMSGSPLMFCGVVGGCTAWLTRAVMARYQTGRGVGGAAVGVGKPVEVVVEERPEVI